MEQQNPIKRSTLESSFGGSIEKNIPDDVEWIDGCFYVKESLFGLHTSILKEPLGQHFLSGIGYDSIVTMTRWHLKCLQDGTLDDYTTVIGDSFVSGKL